MLEIKPITICNLRCKYCFVSAGDYKVNFIADPDYLIKWIKKAIEIKELTETEIHLAPYGEIFLYPDLEELITKIRAIPEVKTISAQTNGLLLTPKKIKMLERVGMDRLNISLNSMDEQQCAKFCGVNKYNLPHLLAMFDLVLATTMDLLIAPVWFMGKNDQGVLDVLQYVKTKGENEGFTWPKLRMGVQNYLTYRTGRKLKKVHMREFKHFYKRIKALEREYGLKLRLGPTDFDIIKTKAVYPPVKLGEITMVDVIRAGRWKNEYIAKMDEQWAVKILSKTPLTPGQMIQVEFIKSSLTGNLLTAVPFTRK